MKRYLIYILLMAATLALFSCKKENKDVIITPENLRPQPNNNEDPNSGTSTEIDYSKASLGGLCEMQGIKLGAAFTYWEYLNNPQVPQILSREFKAVTFGNEMKHDAIVQDNGSLNFTTADKMAQWAKDSGTELFGHVLGWHSQQKTSYLNAVISQAAASDTGDTQPVSLGTIDFEKYTEGASAQLLEGGEFVQINGPDYVSVTSEAAHGGSLSLKMDNSDAHAENSWDVQVVTKSFPVTPGKMYRIQWYGRASKEADLQIDLRGDGDPQYMSSAWGQFGKTGTDWTLLQVNYTVTSGNSLSVAFYGATEAAAYYFDDIQVIALEGSGSGEAVRAAVDAAFKSYVYGMVEHFDVYAWDVVNETFSDGTNGAFRTKETTQNGFVWGTYYSSTKEWVDKAFEYATAACAQYGKTPVLYINDYNLETDPGKRKALCNYAKGNPQVTGVASQMHLDMNTPNLKTKIEDSLKDLTATGKMVRIAELDLKNQSEEDQADIFKFIFEKYLEIVPAAQRGGITFWGINDKDSWVGEENHPLVWKGANYEKKKAYEVLYLYLCELNGINPYKE